MFLGHDGLLGAFKDCGLGTILSVSLCMSFLLGSVLIAWSCHTRLPTAAVVTVLAYLIGVSICVPGMLLLEGLLELSMTVFRFALMR